MEIFDGRKEAKKLDKEIIEHLKQTQVTPVLGIIQVGNNEASNKYVALKQRVGEKLGIDVRVYKYADTLSDNELEENITQTLNNEEITKIIVQLPLPRQSLYKILNKIPQEKDVDILSHKAMEKYYAGDLSFSSPVVKACEYFLDSISIKNKDKKAIIVGGGDLVGKPIAYFLKTNGWDIKIIEDYKRGKSLNADLLILSAGIAKLVSGEDIARDTNVIDFGSSVINNKTVGDLDMETNLDHLGTISPSPGGMGPLVVRFLLRCI
jgi:methylenetetrahydrofolate dehydrogenase (NADP+) / methenyltetrahydrofolate cyclohydrolase